MGVRPTDMIWENSGSNSVQLPKVVPWRPRSRVLFRDTCYTDSDSDTDTIQLRSSSSCRCFCPRRGPIFCRHSRCRCRRLRRCSNLCKQRAMSHCISSRRKPMHHRFPFHPLPPQPRPHILLVVHSFCRTLLLISGSSQADFFLFHPVPYSILLYLVPILSLPSLIFISSLLCPWTTSITSTVITHHQT